MASPVVKAIIRISATFLPGNMRTSHGFTLLEMVVVLVLVGVITALALPGLERMYASSSQSLVRDELDATLNHLALAARHQRLEVVFAGYPEGAEQLPGESRKRFEALGLTMKAVEPITITAAGFCPQGGLLKVNQGSRTYDIELRSPDCRVVKPL